MTILRGLLSCSGAAVVLAISSLAAQQGARDGGWTRYGGDAGATRYAPLDQINKDNVSRLRIAWRRPAVDASISATDPNFSFGGNFRATPLMIDGVLYSPNGIGLVEAFHPGTGKTIWVQQPFPDEGAQGLRGDSSRGVTYWSEGSERRLFVVRGEYLHRARSRRPASRCRLRRAAAGSHCVRASVRAAPAIPGRGAAQICRDVSHRRRRHRRIDVGSRRRGGRACPAWSRRSTCAPGKPRWKFNPIPRPGEVGSETWENDAWALAGDANLWSLISADEEQGSRLSAADRADQRHVWRPPARRQPVRQHAGVRPLRHRRARLALPDRPSRSVGLRPAGRADPRGHQGRRQTDSRRSSSSPSRRSRSSSIA